MVLSRTGKPNLQNSANSVILSPAAQISKAAHIAKLFIYNYLRGALEESIGAYVHL